MTTDDQMLDRVARLASLRATNFIDAADAHVRERADHYSSQAQQNELRIAHATIATRVFCATLIAEALKEIGSGPL